MHYLTYAAGAGGIISYVCNMTVFIFLCRVMYKQDLDIMTIILATLMAAIIFISSGSLFLTIKRMLTIRELQLSEGEMVVGRSAVKAEQIEMIMKMGYFKPCIGIKLRGRKFVPGSLFFRFRNEDEGWADLCRWTEKNRVSMANKPFLILL